MTDGVIAEVDVSDWELLSDEPAGLDEKLWLVEPGSQSSWLFKPVKRHETWQQGENWSEKLASEIGGLLGVAVAHVDMALRHGSCGSVSRNVIPPHWEMQHGAVLLGNNVPGYEPGMPERHGHSLANVRAALEGYRPPPNIRGSSGWNAFGVFAGYLVLDALIAHRDRHEENWAVLRPPLSDRPGCLAPSYDHASSLGFNLQDRRRERLLTEQRVGEFARKGTAWRFEASTGTTLVQLASDGLRMAGPRARTYWLERLANVDPASWEDGPRNVRADSYLCPKIARGE